MDSFPRPSHADFTYQEKYGIRASSGGGRSSARETIARVAGGAIAEKVLALPCGVEIVAFVSSVGDEHLFPHVFAKPTVDPDFLRPIETVTRKQVDDHLPVRCPESKTVGPTFPSSDSRFAFLTAAHHNDIVLTLVFSRVALRCSLGYLNSSRAYGPKDYRTS